MAVKELPPFVWRAFAEGNVALSEDEDGASAGNYRSGAAELTEGKHYWEVEVGRLWVGYGGTFFFWSGKYLGSAISAALT
jgi:hypothetical protein